MSNSKSFISRLPFLIKDSYYLSSCAFSSLPTKLLFMAYNTFKRHPGVLNLESCCLLMFFAFNKDSQSESLDSSNVHFIPITMDVARKHCEKVIKNISPLTVDVSREPISQEPSPRSRGDYRDLFPRGIDVPEERSHRYNDPYFPEQSLRVNERLSRMAVNAVREQTERPNVWRAAYRRVGFRPFQDVVRNQEDAFYRIHHSVASYDSAADVWPLLERNSVTDVSNGRNTDTSNDSISTRDIEQPRLGKKESEKKAKQCEYVLQLLLSTMCDGTL